ncbi:MAG: Predicted integral membrane protein [uncultured Thermomicrobiales bacterium]|uniref:Predicted integral membrane protein n=1 Tax=uncultured Thermomicrobiales bacterium TaxID=1645740 RepID=A0A6J4V4H8_9BACT|nr:MAG: Predicted integral membrane protein [uncultured Thermomicrobiales bacterium]
MSSDTARIDNVQRRARARGRSAAGSVAESLAFPLAVWAIHLLLTQIPATLAYQFGNFRSTQGFGPKSGAYGGILEPLGGIAGWIAEPFRHWDGTWYRLVAVEGYAEGGAAKAAFWPLYPWLMEFGAGITGLAPETVGYLISNVAFLGALIVLYRLIGMDFNAEIARRTLWVLALFPTAFFFTAVYTESLFLLLASAALLGARRGEWLVAGILGLFAALTRSSGFMLLAPFGVLFIQQYGMSPRRWFPHVVPAALPVLGPIIFGWFLRANGRSFFAFAEEQWQWNRFSATPWRTIDCTIRGCREEVRQFGGVRDSYIKPIDWGWPGELLSNLNWRFITSSDFRYRVGESHILEFLVTVVAFALVLVGLKKLPLYYTAFIVPPLIVPLLTPSSVNPLMSMPRFVLPLFPLFVMIAILLRGRKLAVPLAVGSSFLLVILTMQFAQWYWVA